MANKKHLIVSKEHRIGHWRKQNPGVIFDLSGADLRNANFYQQNLQDANLRGANLQFGNLANANFRNANLRNADLRNANLSRTNLSGADLRNANLRDAKLVDTNLSLADISGADLSHADLSDADLQAVQALGTVFTKAQLTGVFLGDWNINGETKLDEVICDYIYLQPNQQERRPHNGCFASGEFVILFQKVLETVDLIFTDGIDWKAFFASFTELHAQYQDSNLSVQSIEKKNGGAFVIRLEINPDVDKAIIESQARALYENELRVLEAQYRAELKAKDAEITIYRQQSTDLIEIIKLQATRPISVEAKAVAASQSDLNTFNNRTINTDGGNYNERIEGNYVQGNYYAARQQNLTQAAAEIQQLLQQLEQTNPTTTTSEKMTVVAKAVDEIEKNPTLKARVIGSLKSGGKEALKEAIDHPLVNILIASIEGWQEAE